MVDIINEIQDDLRQEKVISAVKKYGPYVGTLVLVVLITTAGYLGWMSYTSQRTAAVSEAYTKATQISGDRHQTKIEALEALANTHNNHFGTLSLFKKAILEKNHAPHRVATTYGSILDSRAPDYVKNYATFLTLLHDIHLLTETPGAELSSSDGADAILQRLQAFEQKAPTWAYVSRLLQAQVLAFSGQHDKAKDILVQLVEGNDVPSDVAELAQAYLSASSVGISGHLAISDLLK